MASVESIGACSLDFETSAADNFMTKDLTASERTLMSAGAIPSIKESVKNGDVCQNGITQDEQESSPSKACHLANGVIEATKQEYTTADIKLPSYVSISCAINGYTNFSRFCRSRDNSPARTSFRKSSLETSMLSEMNSRETNSLPYDDMRSNVRCTRSHSEYNEINREFHINEHCARSQSDCNGTMHSMFTESRHITVSKKLSPLKSTTEYMSEMIIGNGQYTPERKEIMTSPSKAKANGHSTERLSLAKEVGSEGTKSLVQQRIESLYGKSASDEMKIKTPNKQKIVHVNGSDKNVSPPASTTLLGKTRLGSTSPPVFRHLTKDFRKQLQGTPDTKPDLHISKSPKSREQFKENPVLSHVAKNGFSPLHKVNGHDECDRMVSKSSPITSSEILSKGKEEVQISSADLENEREGYKFLQTLDCEKARIENEAKSLEELLKTSPNIPEEASGKIRAACGKANLLVTKKFEQFRGLCKQNIEGSPDVPFYTTGSDLAGFWDLVMLQVDDIDSTFKEIYTLKGNNWKETVEKPRVETKQRLQTSISRSTPCTPKRSTKAADLARARNEARKQLLAAKKKGRQQNATVVDSDVAIFAPATSN